MKTLFSTEGQRGKKHGIEAERYKERNEKVHHMPNWSSKEKYQREWKRGNIQIMKSENFPELWSHPCLAVGMPTKPRIKTETLTPKYIRKK